MEKDVWVDVGDVEVLRQRTVQPVTVGRTRVALTYQDGKFGAIHGSCNHVGGPLSEGTLDGEYVVCPWHYWKFHRLTGRGEPGYEQDAVPVFDVQVKAGRVLIRSTPLTKRSRQPHSPHPLARTPRREEGAIRVLGLSTTAMTVDHPRYSTSDDLLKVSLNHASEELGCAVQLIHLRDLSFRPCEGFYSKSSRACTWPCSITQMDPEDEMAQVYEALVHWADVLILSTPIRWGSASSLYYKMVERMNCVQNQETLSNTHLLKNKVGGFIITGGQDNIQAVAGQLLGFFAEIGVQFPQFPYIAHSRGWSAEDMENNMRYVQRSDDLRDGAQALVQRCVEMAKVLVQGSLDRCQTARGGRKAHQLDPAARSSTAPSEQKED